VDIHRREALLKEYGEVSNTFRTLTDVRFKLLTLLPIAAAAGALVKGENLGIGSFAFNLFGFAATIGLITYNARNDQLYDELVGRAASIERSLGLPDGAFANRPRPWLTIRLPAVNRKWKVDHRTGVAVIYGASVALWLFGLLAPILEFARNTYFPLRSQNVIAAAPPHIVALTIAILSTLWMGIAIRNQRKKRKEEMRSLAARAVKRALSLKLSEAAQNTKLLDLCATLANEDEDTIRARALFYSSRIDPDSLRDYLPYDSQGREAVLSKELEAAHFVALLTDLPPGWLFDCATNRRGTVRQGARQRMQSRLSRMIDHLRHNKTQTHR
jgi:hypothetical protein